MTASKGHKDTNPTGVGKELPPAAKKLTELLDEAIQSKRDAYEALMEYPSDNRIIDRGREAHYYSESGYVEGLKTALDILRIYG